MNKIPYHKFGVTLKKIREQANESVIDVSGAVETDVAIINQLEAGTHQPSEDIVLLLISHFGLKEDDALRLWRLAGYDQDKTGISSVGSDDQVNSVKAYVTAGDVRILYTDMVHVKSNQHGLVINFLQSLGADDHTMAVARVGMSHTHAESLLEVLKQTINTTKKQQKMLDKNSKPSKDGLK
ncbi:helix-turn-helix transcriptional regulator [Candidatus Saccharibacteria bacterium]|nr:helix-turn-helix transcriptional regulator [Candidatus Saccharibacteria bacterium]MDQ5885369.1 Helix-turn-helix transcriptional regulator [Patescibacteria group bacterium]MDQ5958515.1 Helix-turn-helix transcriptional regulator [Patescibacteria group bacterium]